MDLFVLIYWLVSLAAVIWGLKPLLQLPWNAVRASAAVCDEVVPNRGHELGDRRTEVPLTRHCWWGSCVQRSAELGRNSPNSTTFQPCVQGKSLSLFLLQFPCLYLGPMIIVIILIILLISTQFILVFIIVDTCMYVYVFMTSSTCSLSDWNRKSVSQQRTAVLIVIPGSGTHRLTDRWQLPPSPGIWDLEYWSCCEVPLPPAAGPSNALLLPWEHSSCS